jgi:hypothetical protein
MLGRGDRPVDQFDDAESFCDQRLSKDSIYSYLHREREQLLPDDAFADLYDDQGRRSVPPSVVATVMVLQRLEGLSDREAVERYCFDTRWRYACGVGGYGTGWPSFAHTVLVDMRERLRRSERPDRIFEAALGAAKEAGVVGRRRVLDSTSLYDAVTTMDTVTLIRSAIRRLLHAATPALEAELRGVLRSGDDYASLAKPQIDWDNSEARSALIDSRAKDAYACLALLDGEVVGPEVGEAAQLLATVVAQDLEVGTDGVLRIARRVAHDRVISTVDPDARHGHKTEARGFDGYKGHVAIDPDSEIITAAAVTAGNVTDSATAKDLIGDLISPQDDAREGYDEGAPRTPALDDDVSDEDAQGDGAQEDGVAVYADTQYGTGEFQALLENANIDSKCKTQRPVGLSGLYPKDRFAIDLVNRTVTCPYGVTVAIRPQAGTPDADGSGTAFFGKHCTGCALAEQCTRSRSGRTIAINRFEAALSRARTRQADPDWKVDYRATRPKVERKVSHLMRRKHGGRRARVRGCLRVEADFKLLAAATNFARLAVIGVWWAGDGWTTTGAGSACTVSRHDVNGVRNRNWRRFWVLVPKSCAIGVRRPLATLSHLPAILQSNTAPFLTFTPAI